ncbi:hypothetical protein MPLSOD_280025 [Mesorhizobium sp. SOD10]|nr:hypothetical protein MPLSOD_280025 [Mesorhizobium sp. SOD10]
MYCAVSADIDDRNCRIDAADMASDLPSALAAAQANVSHNATELFRISVKGSEALSGAAQADYFKASFLKRRLNVEQYHRLVFNDQNRAIAHFCGYP